MQAPRDRERRMESGKRVGAGRPPGPCTQEGQVPLKKDPQVLSHQSWKFLPQIRRPRNYLVHALKANALLIALKNASRFLTFFFLNRLHFQRGAGTQDPAIKT